MAKEVTIRMTVDSSGATAGLRTLSTEAQKTGKNLKETGKASQEAGGAIKNIAGAVDFAMKAFAALKAFDMVGDFVNQGRAIRATSATFGALTANIGGATNVLNMLRTATGGVVTDMNLMQANNRFLQMGLATTAESAAELSRIAVILGGSMGKDAAGAMEEFALMLANQSLPRLDTFGISAGRVRTRIQELQEATAGLTREQAFVQATMEEAQKSIENLGAAAGVAMDGLSRLETAFANMVDNIEERAATGALAIADFFQWITGTHPAQQQAAQNASIEKSIAEALAPQNIADMLADITSLVPDMTPAQQNAITKIITGMQDAAINDPRVKDNAGILFGLAVNNPESGFNFREQFFTGRGFSELGGMDADALVQMVYEQRSAYNEMQRNQAEVIMTEQQQAAEMAAARQSFYDSLAGEDFNQHQINRPSRLINPNDTDQFNPTSYAARYNFLVKLSGMASDVYSTLSDIPTQAGAFGDRISELLVPRENARGLYDKITSGLGRNAGSALSGFGIDIDSLFSMSRDIQLPEFMRPETAQAIAQQYSVVEEQWARMAELNDQGLITDDELARITTFRDNMANVNRDAQAAAQAFENMSLTDLFGTTSGGIMGQLSDMTIQAARANGASPEEIASMQRNLDLASGRETTSSLAFQEQLAPFIANLNPEEQVLAIQNLTATLQEFELAGGNLNNLTPEQMIQMTGFVGSGDAGSFEINPGDTLGAVQQRLAAQGYQLAISDLLTATGASSTTTVQPGQYGFGQGAGAVQGFNPASYAAQLLMPSANIAMPGAGTFLTEGFQGVINGSTGGLSGEGVGLGGEMTAAAESTSTMDTAMSSVLSNTTTLVEEYLPTFTENMGALSASSDTMAAGFERANGQVGALKDELSAISEAEHNVVINFTLRGDTATLAALSAVMGGNMSVAESMAAATQANNGRPPGVDLRA